MIDGGTTSSGDIFYSAAKGEDVTLELDRFEDFWNDYRSSSSTNTLSYITINSVSGGTLYTSGGTKISASTSSTSTSSRLYVDPSTSSQKDLDGIYFSPNSRTTSSGTVKFTAYGSRSGSVSGTVAISFLSSSASVINYTTGSNGKVSLDYTDFVDAYKEATGSRTTPSNLVIVFQNVPAYGTMTYKTTSTSSSTSTLTSSNVTSRRFNAKSSGSNRIDDVTYTASGTRTETVDYIAYLGTTASFSGKVSFNGTGSSTAPTNVSVNLPTCYTNAGVTLSSANFTNANSALNNASYIILGNPRSGRLVSSTGSATTNTAVSMSLLGTITYVPNAGTTYTTDSFIFTAYNASGNIVASGTVSVTVSLSASAAPSGSVTSINQLTDVMADSNNNWYTAQLSYVISKGNVNGKAPGVFGPNDTLEYSAALKFIMNAAGYYEEQSTAPGTNWAENYKRTAVSRGWMSSDQDLTKSITRLQVAELTVKVLGIPVSSNAYAFNDVSSVYASTLYEKNIMKGTGTAANGKPIFQDSKEGYLTRAQMIVLVYNMYNYLGK